MRAARQQHGFTLVEMLMAMVLAVIVFGATLYVLDSYMHFWQGQTRRTDAQNTARLGVDRIVRQMRNISSPITTPKLLERATPYDIVFQTIGSPSGLNVTGDQRVRYCIPQDSTSGDPSKEVLYGETQTWTTSSPPASPWSSGSSEIPCPDNPLPSGVASSSNPKIVATSVTNRYKQATTHPAFTFNNTTADPNNLGQVFTVQLDLFVNPTPGQPNEAQSEIKSAAFLRNQPRSPVAQFTWTATGSGGVLLNGGTSYSPDGQNLSFAWSCSGSCPNASELAISNSGLVNWRPGAGTYTVTLTVTDQTGLVTTSSPQQVTVT